MWLILTQVNNANKKMTMPNKILFVFLFLINAICFGQNRFKGLLDSVILKSKQTSMYSQEINWDSLQTQLYKKAENAKSIQDLKPAFEALLNGLKDHHGKIINAVDYSILAYFTNTNKCGTQITVRRTQRLGR